MTANTLFEEVATRIEAAPRSGQALLLYALVKTLVPQRAGHAYLLTKLKEMNPDTRALAYRLMEVMAAGEAPAAEWQAFEARLDGAIRG